MTLQKNVRDVHFLMNIHTLHKQHTLGPRVASNQKMTQNGMFDEFNF